MSEVELVIKIPEEMYKWVNDANKIFNDYGTSDFIDLVKNGTPLTKGHGRLKDTDAICKDIISALGIRDENYLLEAEEAIYKRIKNAPTIIEADKAESEECFSALHPS